MAFTTDEKASIRKYLGMSRLFINSNPILESAMTAIEQLNDAGATENQMRSVLTKLATVEQRIDVAQSVTLASEVVGEVRIDAARQLAILRKEGTAMISGLCIPLSMKPFRKYFYAMDVDEDMNIQWH